MLLLLVSFKYMRYNRLTVPFEYKVKITLLLPFLKLLKIVFYKTDSGKCGIHHFLLLMFI